MKILFIISDLGNGGAQRVLTTLVDYFVDKLDYKITLVTYDNNVKDFYLIDERILRIKIDYKIKKNILLKYFQRIKRLKTIRKIIKDEKADIVVPLIVYTNMETILSAIGLNINIVAVEHSSYYGVKSRYIRILRIILYRLVNRVILLTERDKNIYEKHLKNCVVIPNPIVLKNQKSGNERQKKLLCVGRLNKVKQFDHAIFVLSKIIKSRSDWSLTIVGSGDELNFLKNYSRQLGIYDYVNFMGSIKDIGEIYNSHSIFVLTSSHEGFPMALGEAMMDGMAVVSYDCPTGPSEMIENGKSGVLIEHNNKTKLELAIIDLIDNKQKREFLGENATVRMKDFSLKKVGEKWNILFNNIIKENEN